METLRVEPLKFGESFVENPHGNAEPSPSNGEGVESRRGAPKGDGSYGEGVLQTTNIEEDGSESYSGTKIPGSNLHEGSSPSLGTIGGCRGFISRGIKETRRYP